MNIQIERILPIMGEEHEYDDLRFMLKQLKKRNPSAFNKIISYY